MSNSVCVISSDEEMDCDVEISDTEARKLTADFLNRMPEKNEAIALMFLQKNRWNLDLAFSDYKDQVVLELSKTQPNICSSINLTDLSQSFSSSATSPSHSQYPPDLISLITWNIEGLNTKALDQRMNHVADYIMKIRPQFVCFQEMTVITLALLQSRLEEYYYIFNPQDFHNREYWANIFVLRHPAFKQIKFRSENFKNSVMGRHAIYVDLDINRAIFSSENVGPDLTTHIRVYSTHLESCKEFTEPRMKQLGQLWKKIQNDLVSGSCKNQNSASIMCGDLNLRDSEVNTLGGVPNYLTDVWAICGSRPEAKFTWDPRKNINCSLLVGNKAFAMRYDRIYQGGSGLRPVNFELQGLEKVPGQQCHASDHWALLAHFQLV